MYKLSKGWRCSGEGFGRLKWIVLKWYTPRFQRFVHTMSRIQDNFISPFSLFFKGCNRSFLFDLSADRDQIKKESSCLGGIRRQRFPEPLKRTVENILKMIKFNNHYPSICHILNHSGLYDFFEWNLVFILHNQQIQSARKILCIYADKSPVFVENSPENFPSCHIIEVYF